MAADMDLQRSLPPLSHHDVLRAAAALTRRGLRVDLAASDRAARKIMFVEQPLAARADIVVGYTLYLLEEEASVLIRIARCARTLQATLSTQGPDIEALADALDSLPVQEQFRAAGNALVADSYDIAPQPDATPTLTSCATVVHGVLIQTDARTVIGEPMNTTLTTDAAPPFTPPDDLLALTHPGFRPLSESDDGWITTLKVPVREPARSRETRRRFALMAAAVERALGAPAEAYHRPRRAARWRLYARRFIPVIICIAIVVALLVFVNLFGSDGRRLHPAFVSLPPLLMTGVLILTYREMPRIEIPPRPQPLAADAWRTKVNDPTGTAT